MIKQLIVSFLLALQNIRSHFFHTLLSVLGIVIGVASLVSILSLIDGMEQYAKDQITNTTSLNTIAIRTEPFKTVNGIRLRKDTASYLSYADFTALEKTLSLPAKAYLGFTEAREIQFGADTMKTAAHVAAVVRLDPRQQMLHGKELTEKDVINRAGIVIITASLAKALHTGNIKETIGKKLTIGNKVLTVVGVLKDEKEKHPSAFLPLTLYADEEIRKNVPQCDIEAAHVEDVPKLKAEVQHFLKTRYPESNDFNVITNEMRVAQAAQGFQVFRVIMGLIVGISVLVGGIGVMNVLVISVTERTVEIGIRKAVGANKRDIILQFLSESVTISMFGSIIGLITGMLGTMIMVPVIKSLVKIPFYAAYTLNTLMVVGVLAVVVGIIFGTYPAMRAAKLDPVEAIRRE